MSTITIFGFSAQWLLQGAWSVLSALLVLIAGWIVAKLLSRQIVRLLPNQLNRDRTIVPLLSQVVRYGVIMVTVIIVLGQFGVQTTSILAVLGAAGLAIALALQGTLSNIAAGILLVVLRPFNVGDKIDAEGTISGTVVEIGLFATQLRTDENVYMFVPNSRLSNARIINWTRQASRILTLGFTVPRGTDLDHVRDVMQTALTLEPEAGLGKPDIVVETFTDSAVSLTARVPVPSQKWDTTRFRLQEILSATLDREKGFAPQPQTPAGT